MRFISVSVVLCLFFAVAFSATSYETAFTEWSHKHGKSYSSEDFLSKFATFTANFDRINAHNSGSASYKIGLNEFSDLTFDEFKATHLGYSGPPGTGKRAAEEEDARTKRGTCASGYSACGTGCCPSGYVCTTSKQCISCGSGYTTCATGECCPSTYTCDATGCTGAQVATGGALTPTVNWTAHGVVTAVKNQGNCGSCWSFSATGAVEAAHNIKHSLSGSSAVSLSEQNLIDCANATYQNQGCNGGTPQYAFNYIKANGGIDTETSYPLTAGSTGTAGKCAYKAANSGAAISGWTSIKAGDETTLGSQVAIQPVTVAICAADSLQGYASGVYDDSACGSGSTAALNHAVLIVGYGTDTKAGAYWVVKNSWGTSWGMNGYFLLQKGTNRCGVAQQAAYPIST